MKCDGDQWSVTSKGIFLCSSHPTSLAEAAEEYATDLRDPWCQHATALRYKSDWQPPDISQKVAADDAGLIPHHRMLNSFAEQDYALILHRPALRGDDHVVDKGGGLVDRFATYISWP